MRPRGELAGVVLLAVAVASALLAIYALQRLPEAEWAEEARLRLYEELRRSGAKVLNVPFVRQKPWYCSEASASMVLRYYGFNVSQDDVHDAGYESFETMLPFLRRYLNCSYARLTPEALKAEIDGGRPVIIRIVVGGYLHTVVVVGYKGDAFYIHDPARGPYVEVSRKELVSVWGANNYRAIVVRGLRRS